MYKKKRLSEWVVAMLQHMNKTFSEKKGHPAACVMHLVRVQFHLFRVPTNKLAFVRQQMRVFVSWDTAALGEACLVEVGQGIQLLGGGATPPLPCGEPTFEFEAVSWCRIFLISAVSVSPFLAVSLPNCCLNIIFSSFSCCFFFFPLIHFPVLTQILLVCQR